MPIVFEPKITASRAEDARPGRLVIMHIRNEMRVGLIAHIADRQAMHLIPLAPADRLQFMPLTPAAQSFVDLGDDVVLGCLPGLDTIAMSAHEGNDRIGSLLITGDGVTAIAITPSDDGDARYYELATGEVTFARPDARAIITDWSISVGSQDRRTKITDVIARHPAD